MPRRLSPYLNFIRQVLNPLPLVIMHILVSEPFVLLNALLNIWLTLIRRDLKVDQLRSINRLTSALFHLLISNFPSQHIHNCTRLAAPPPAQPTAHHRQVANLLTSLTTPLFLGSSTETEMSDCRESASKSGSSNGSSKLSTEKPLAKAHVLISDLIGFTPNQTLASLAIFAIFVPFFKPDVLLMGHSRESAHSLTKKISPIFWQVTQSLSVPECGILCSARQAFINSNKENWDLHRFAISKNRDYQVEKEMAYWYSVQVGEDLDVAGYDSSFDKLKVNLLVLIRVHILTYIKAKN
ncbi:hypothetical protein ACLOAV_010194 [Pseudogymnoascus australis]